MPLQAAADSFVFSTGNPDARMATATRPESPGKFEIETGDDFALTQQTRITGAAFTGLIPYVVVEIYRVFPADSDVGRTPKVPRRLNSPSDVAFAERNASEGSLSFIPTVVQASFTVSNSVQPGGIHLPPPGTTGGNGPVTGQETVIAVTFTTPFDLAAGQYFFVPQVEMTTANGDFLWLSAPRPIVPPGTPFPPRVY
jgi:hypothetical protein